MDELSICVGTACHLKGSYNIIQAFLNMIEENSLHDRIDFKTTFCTRKCEKQGIGVVFNGQTYNIKPEDAREFFRTVVTGAIE